MFIPVRRKECQEIWCSFDIAGIFRPRKVDEIMGDVIIPPAHFKFKAFLEHKRGMEQLDLQPVGVRGTA